VDAVCCALAQPVLRRPAGANPISTLGYGYDAIGNVTSLSDAVNPGADRTFTYDFIDRLLGMPNVSQQNAVYDGSGNMWLNPNVSGASGPVRSSTYAADRLLRVDTGLPPSFAFSQTLDYDVYGNVTRRGSASFAFNDAQQMRCALCGQANEIQYAYDGQGMRVSSSQSGRTTYFVHGSGGNLMWDVAPDGEVKEYIYAGGRQIAVRRVVP
jgi:hypothetical protein